ncbi:MAG: enoyl-CoA hydratase/isomerase family protein [Candidatus Binatia bacterium]
MSAAHVLYDVVDRVGLITLNRPEVMNAFSGTMREDLLRALQQAEADPGVRCLVITGAGRAFCAGGDIASMVELQNRDDTLVIHQRMAIGAQVVHLLRKLSKPVIAAVNGAAAGAGMNLALACDMRFAAESAKFAESFVKIALVPDWGGTYFLTQLVGAAKAMELMMSGDRIDTAEALRLGILNRVYPDDTFREDVMAFARQLAAGPASTLAYIKRAVYIGATGSLSESLSYEEQAQPQVFLSADAREGMRAFLEKRRPQFS